jgi:ribosomal protein S19E (S16A)
MTISEFMTAVIAVEGMPADLCEFAESEIAKLDARNAKRAEKPSKTALANEPIKVELFELLEEMGGVHTASAVVEKLEGKYSVQKVSSLLRQLANEGKLNVVEVKVKGKGKQKGYTIAETESEVE